MPIKSLDEMAPEKRAAVEAILNKNRTPEARAARRKGRELADSDAPDTPTPAPLMPLFAAMKARRLASDLTLAAASALSGIERSMIQRLETGQIGNPTVATLRAYAAALGARLEMTLTTGGDAPAVAAARIRRPASRPSVPVSRSNAPVTVIKLAGPRRTLPPPVTPGQGGMFGPLTTPPKSTKTKIADYIATHRAKEAKRRAKQAKKG